MRQEYNRFLGEVVNIAIPHIYEKHKLFYLSGLVIDVDDNFLVLKIKNGLRKIPLSDVIEISTKKKGSQYNDY